MFLKICWLIIGKYSRNIVTDSGVKMAEDIDINDAEEFSVCRDSGMFVIF